MRRKRPDHVLVAPSAGNLDGVGLASTKAVLAVDQPPPTGPDDRWSSRGPRRAPVRRGRSQTPVSIGFADALSASALGRDPVEQLSVLTAVCLRSNVAPSGSRPAGERAAVMAAAPERDSVCRPVMLLN